MSKEQYKRERDAIIGNYDRAASQIISDIEGQARSAEGRLQQLRDQARSALDAAQKKNGVGMINIRSSGRVRVRVSVENAKGDFAV